MSSPRRGVKKFAALSYHAAYRAADRFLSYRVAYRAAVKAVHLLLAPW